MTRRLGNVGRGAVGLRLLAERWAKPTADEARALSLPPGQLARVRDIILLCDGRPCIYGRTVMPLHSVRGRQRRLLQLGPRPLGPQVFSRTRVRRSALMVREVAAGDPLLRALEGHVPVGTRLWARRSRLQFQTSMLLITEVFLPALMEELARE